MDIPFELYYNILEYLSFTETNNFIHMVNPKLLNWYPPIKNLLWQQRLQWSELKIKRKPFAPGKCAACSRMRAAVLNLTGDIACCRVLSVYCSSHGDEFFMAAID